MSELPEPALMKPKSMPAAMSELVPLSTTASAATYDDGRDDGRSSVRSSETLGSLVRRDRNPVPVPPMRR